MLEENQVKFDWTTKDEAEGVHFFSFSGKESADIPPQKIIHLPWKQVQAHRKYCRMENKLSDCWSAMAALVSKATFRRVSGVMRAISHTFSESAGAWKEWLVCSPALFCVVPAFGLRQKRMSTAYLTWPFLFIIRKRLKNGWLGIWLKADIILCLTSTVCLPFFWNMCRNVSGLCGLFLGCGQVFSPELMKNFGVPKLKPGSYADNDLAILTLIWEILNFLARFVCVLMFCLHFRLKGGWHASLSWPRGHGQKILTFS